MKRIVIFLFVGLLFMSLPAEAQVFKKLKKLQEQLEKNTGKEAEKKVEEEVEEVDEEVDEASEQAANAILESLLGGEKAEVADIYSFDALMEMTFITYEEGEKKSDGKMNSYLSNEGNQFAYKWTDGNMANKNQQGMVIYDIKRSAMIILGQDKDKKSGMIYGIDLEDWQEDLKENPEEDLAGENIEQSPHFRKTGKKKTIHGHICHEYLAKDSAVVAHYWISKDVKGDYARYMKKANPAFGFHHAAWPGGFLMEADIEDLSDNQRHIMQVTDLDLDRKTTINLGEYNLINLGSMKLEQDQ